MQVSPALFQNIFKYCTFGPNFQLFYLFRIFLFLFFPFFWKNTPMPLLSRIKTDNKGYKYEDNWKWYNILRKIKNLMKGTNKISIESKNYLRILQNLVLIKKKGLQEFTIAHPQAADYILTNTKKKIVECWLINPGLSDHPKIFCKRKTKRKYS